MKVGIIGLGLMGMAFSKSLLSKGFEVYGCDIAEDRLQELESAGGHPCKTAAEVGAVADAVIVMVFSADNVRSVLYNGEGALLNTLPAGKSILVCCSVGTDVVEEIAPDIKSRGIRLLDTPLMGDCGDAEAGCIHIIIGASQEDYQEVEPLLKAMGPEHYFVGTNPGDGQKAKSCLQALFSLTFEMGFEITNLAKATGLNLDEVRRMFKNSPSSSVLFHISEDKVLDRVYTGTKNPLAILDKDIQIALQLGEKYGLTLNSCAGTAKTFRSAVEQFPKEDIWAAAKVVEGK